MNRLLSVLFWSVIAAAFIGPGTVATCASAGARFDLRLLWTLGFSTIACFVLQEAAARITVITGRDLGGAIRQRLRGRRTGLLALLLVLGGILLGCAAYEAGNILGAVAGASLGLPLSGTAVTLLCGAAAALLLWFGKTRNVACVLGAAVGLMGIAFVVVAFHLAPSPAGIVRPLLVPTMPGGSALLVLGLIGTTVVPYNLFLGSGLARGQSLGQMRFGLAVAVPIGGLLSMAIMVVGTAVPAPFEFSSLSSILTNRLGGWAAPLFALGLFTAGLSSAVTAPLAAAVTARGLFGEGQPDLWTDRGRLYRAVWIAVLLVGVGFGLAGTKPIPAILLAQAFNGLLLPFVTVFLLIVINDAEVMGDAGRNRWFANLVMAGVTFVTLLLGARLSLGAVASALGRPAPGGATMLIGAFLTAALIAIPIIRGARRDPPAVG